MGTCVKFGPTQLPVGLGLGPNLIDRNLGGPEPDTSATKCNLLLNTVTIDI